MELTPDGVTWLYRSLLGRDPEGKDTRQAMIRTFQTFENARKNVMNSSEFFTKSKRIKHLHNKFKETRINEVFSHLVSLLYGHISAVDFQGDFTYERHPSFDVFSSFQSPAKERIVLCLGDQKLRNSLIGSLSSQLNGNCLLIDLPFLASTQGQDEVESTTHICLPRPSKYKGPKSTVYYLPVIGNQQFLWDIMSAISVDADIVVCPSDQIKTAADVEIMRNLASRDKGCVMVLGDSITDVARKKISQLMRSPADIINIPGGYMFNVFDFQTKVVIPYGENITQAASTFYKDQHRLAFSAIVKNEEPRIGDTLKSVFPIVSFVALLDTGSTDNTIGVAKELCETANIPYRIESAEFTTFDDIRNKAVKLVPEYMEWILMLDADEIIVERDYAKFFELMSREEDAWSLPRYNIRDNERKYQPLPYPNRQTRLFKNLPHLFWGGFVHETLRGAQNKGFAPLNTIVINGEEGGPHIHHLAALTRKPSDQALKPAFYGSLMALTNPLSQK